MTPLEAALIGVIGILLGAAGGFISKLIINGKHVPKEQCELKHDDLAKLLEIQFNGLKASITGQMKDLTRRLEKLEGLIERRNGDGDPSIGRRRHNGES